MLSFQKLSPLLPKTFGKIYIAYSGGIDSQVLLHLCATQSHLRDKLIAVYVHHGLQTVADDWATHCSDQAQTLGVNFLCLRVDAKPKKGESPEAAARKARYQALQPLLQSGDLLLLAQHREDQLETVLLQLFRGAGVQGLSAMPVAAQFGLGTMLRPLLHVAKADIQAYAQFHTLDWVEDPSNLSHDFDRNYLRNAIIPLLKQRWPSLDKTVARSARHCAEATTLLDTWGQQELKRLVDPADHSLSLEELQTFQPPQQNWLLRKWFEYLSLKPPSTALINSLHQQLICASNDASPEIFAQGHSLRKYRQRLFCLTLTQLDKPIQCIWPIQASTISMSNGYVLSRTTADTGINRQLWDNATISIRPRSGGEKLKLPGRDGHHNLKKLYQETGTPPWVRESCPLLYLDNRLAAVPGLWIAEWAWSEDIDNCYQLTWQLAESM